MSKKSGRKVYQPGTIRTLGAPRRFIGHDSRNAQLMEVGINADEIVKTAKELLATRGH